MLTVMYCENLYDRTKVLRKQEIKYGIITCKIISVKLFHQIFPDENNLVCHDRIVGTTVDTFETLH